MKSILEKSRSSWPWVAWLSLVIWVIPCKGEGIRVTTWDLHASDGGVPARMNEAARELKKLAPDVILLRDAADWKTCSELVQALRPAEYRVITCSAFPAATNGRRVQAAIIARRTAYFSWSQAWAAEADAELAGGFAFAAIQVGNHRVGLYSLVLDAPGGGVDARAQLAAVAQWLNGIGQIRNWAANRIEAIVAAAPFSAPPAAADSASPLLEAGFSFPFPPNPASDLADGHLPANAANPPGLLLNRWPVTCDLDFEPGSLPSVPVALTPVPPPEPVVPLASREKTNGKPGASSVATNVAGSFRPTNLLARAPMTAQQPPPPWQSWLWSGLAGLFVLILLAAGLALRWRARAQPSALVRLRPDGTPERSYTVVITPGSASESLSSGSNSSVARPATHLEAQRTTQTQSEDWRARALEAEQRAAKAAALVKSGMIGHLSHWVKESIARRLISDRARLLEIQQEATLKAMAVDERLSRLEVQLQKQNQAYEQRIETLSRELLNAHEENRELIRAQITRVKAEMEAARERMIAEARSESAG